ncbi:hypothetical protein JAAARDRAFT_30973 [Jaapia argillacea MUCL 33604]|uniref:Phosphatidic acid phosphatase type 2/haloperoxidase domain-containing protein n=1 Tax=Jaapia argillacea MUCL 33604 TaxID=933084 RepID=A0A067Q5T9_9AGAM|nr:hypothetical protein JAAARDRAFT_30973 [Jaapia argillacea MUCL 33604]
MSEVPRASLDLTHVLYDSSSHVSLALALITLSPILLMASYAALAVQTRELVIINMWAGQLLCEGFNWFIKRLVKQERPPDSVGNGYGFPSSHSQYMGYFASFLICHLFFRHRFATTGYPILDQVWRLCIYTGLLAWAGIVAYSRFELTYHSPAQIMWGAGLGVAFGTSFYTLTELIPARFPNSLIGRVRAAFLQHPVTTWIHIRDGWTIYPDGGHSEEWQRWRDEWERQSMPTGKRTD